MRDITVDKNEINLFGNEYALAIPSSISNA
jgi:hypothetical protein